MDVRRTGGVAALAIAVLAIMAAGGARAQDEPAPLQLALGAPQAPRT